MGYSIRGTNGLRVGFEFFNGMEPASVAPNFKWGVQLDLVFFNVLLMFS